MILTDPNVRRDANIRLAIAGALGAVTYACARMLTVWLSGEMDAAHAVVLAASLGLGGLVGVVVGRALIRRGWTNFWQATVAIALIGIFVGLAVQLDFIIDVLAGRVLHPKLELLYPYSANSLYRLLLDALGATMAAPLFWLVGLRRRVIEPNVQNASTKDGQQYRGDPASLSREDRRHVALSAIASLVPAFMTLHVLFLLAKRVLLLFGAMDG